MGRKVLYTSNRIVALVVRERLLKLPMCHLPTWEACFMIRGSEDRRVAAAPARGISKDPPARPYYDVAPKRTL